MVLLQSFEESASCPPMKIKHLLLHSVCFLKPIGYQQYRNEASFDDISRNQYSFCVRMIVALKVVYLRMYLIVALLLEACRVFSGFT